MTCYIPSLSNITVDAWGSSTICNIPDGFIPAEGFRYNIPRQAQTNAIALFFLVGTGGALVINNQSSASLSTGNTMGTAITWFTA